MTDEYDSDLPTPGAFDPQESMARTRHEFGEHGGVNMSISASTTYTVMEAATMPEIFQGNRGPDQGGCYLYGRHFNPTVYVLGHELAAMEGTENAYPTASGMSAVSATLMQLCERGDEVVAGRVLYGGTYALLRDFLPARTGLRTTFVDVTDLDSVEAAMTSRTRVLYVESLANPTLEVADLPALAEIAHAHDALLVVDNTFSPMILSPAVHGADIVLHSLTKFVSGASDIIGGVICGSTDFIMSLMDLNTGALMLLGPTMDPRIAFQLSLRLPHLGLRVKEHSRRALEFSRRLEETGVDVTYPGLTGHPQHELMSRLMNEEYGHGGIFTIHTHSTARAQALMESLQNDESFGYMAVSLGYFDTLMSESAVSTASELGSEGLASAGIDEGLVRVSIGISGTLEQRWAQMERSLARVGLAGSVTA